MGYTPTSQIFTSKLPVMEIDLLRSYRERCKDSIAKRLSEFKALRGCGSERMFYELCYCILTPQSSGLSCDGVVAELAEKGVFLDPINRRAELEQALKRTRFWKTKSRYVTRAWERFFSHEDVDMAEELRKKKQWLGDNRVLRNWFRGEMKGMGIGMKEASHFLRNIGFVENIAIIDRHVISCLFELGVLSDVGAVLKSERDYLEIEEEMTGFSRRHNVPMEELDLLFWSAKTGYVFK